MLNLTTPAAHVPVGLAAIAAGKHVYSEKPLAVSVAEARRLVEAAAAAGLRIGCAPDTFLGGSHQTARALLDAGRIGEPFAGTAFLMLAGHERWHPNPDFYYARAGGGPVLDMAPYYVTDLVQLLGPVAQVAASGTVCRSPRTIGKGPRAGETVAVDCTTHIAGTLGFVSGAIVQVAMSFEVRGHRHTPIEIYGSRGSMLVPDPNRFDGTVEAGARQRRTGRVAEDADHARLRRRQSPHHRPRRHGGGDPGGRPHRASGELAFHVLEVMEGLVRSAEGDGSVTIASRCARPAPLLPGLAMGEMD
ncbi:MAG: Gfo/Idh/MocA family oxidoreductase [Geminicoccaceae bacterium]